MLNSSSNDLAVGVRQWLREQLRECAYPGYVYGYPHKKAYRPLPTPLPLRDVWRGEGRGQLYCYVHIPFCNQRCSFCNLFTYVPTEGSPVPAYLDALGREMDAHAAAMPDARFARLYIGGGTPSYLDAGELRQLMRRLKQALGIDPARTQGCIETSPETLDEGKVALLRELGFARISLGVQSLVEEELHHVNRRFDFALHGRAVEMIGRAGFAHFNIDLIYGLPAQTLASWRESLERSIDTRATSLFLYPLYVRPMTGLGARGRASLERLAAPTTRQMAAMYDVAVERLAEAGFRQVTMRQFRRDVSPGNPSPTGPLSNLAFAPADVEREVKGEGAGEGSDEYRCQVDGMVGLGAGARSYTRALHYSTPWRMVARNIRGVVDDYVERMRRDDTAVSYGFALDDEERRRRLVVQSLLYDGVDAAEFSRAFGSDVRAAFPQEWDALIAEGCCRDDGTHLRLTALGVRHADVVGQVFFSGRVRRLMDEYEYDK